MRAAVVVFPGSNCDADTHWVLNEVAGIEAEYAWHTETDLSGYDVVVLPGGFSHGDYLRSGAVAAKAPVMAAVRVAAGRGVPVLGICNGFQVLLEAGLLPGAMLHNAGIDFRCEWVHLRTETTTTAFTTAGTVGQVLRLPIAHGEGNYHAPAELLARLHDEERVVFRYCDATGARAPGANPNGSVDDIAAICNEARNVVGLMPHPERASEADLGSADGRVIWESLLSLVSA
jgi:phosphoribosylformylglycinamidine synthase subunit PurQ / glutaminase